MANETCSTIGHQLKELIRNKPDEVFTVNEASQLLKAAASSLRVYTSHMPEEQRTRIRKGGCQTIVFGSAKAMAKFKKLMQ